MDKTQHNSAPSPGYETRDANIRGVYTFLVILSLLLIVSGLICWGLFHFLSKQEAEAQSSSPFSETRQLPLGPQLQVNPRQDWLAYRQQQEQSLESYEWENRGAGTVRVPIDVGMQMLLQKGLPTQSATLAPTAAKPAGTEKSAPQEGTKP